MFTRGTLEFLAELKANNDREWFNANKDIYKTQYEAPAKSFMTLMADRLEEKTGIAQKAKLFRIHRDVRFSKDKTPYNTHIHISWMPQDGHEQPAWMFGLAGDYCTIGCGLFAFSKEKLDRFRKTIARDGADFVQIVDQLRAQGYRMSEPDLKRVPSGFPIDSTHSEWLKHKGIAVWSDFDSSNSALEKDLVDQILVRIDDMISLQNFIRDV